MLILTIENQYRIRRNYVGGRKVELFPHSAGISLESILAVEGKTFARHFHSTHIKDHDLFIRTIKTFSEKETKWAGNHADTTKQNQSQSQSIFHISALHEEGGGEQIKISDSSQTPCENPRLNQRRHESGAQPNSLLKLPRFLKSSLLKPSIAFIPRRRTLL